ncbi:hypothetical protein ScPMuIL_010749 [Solemya velum]
MASNLKPITETRGSDNSHAAATAVSVQVGQQVVACGDDNQAVGLVRDLVGQGGADNVFIQIGETNIVGDTHLQRLLDKTDTELKEWGVRRSVFIETAAFLKCREHLEGGHVHIMGVSGEGKTAIAKELLTRSPRTPIILREPEQWEHVDVKMGKSIVLVDDIFGQFGLDNERKRSWLRKVANMYSAVCTGEVQIITTCRENIFLSCDTELRGFELFKTNNVHLSDSSCTYALNEEERLRMLHKYIEAAEPKIIVETRDRNQSPSMDGQREISLGTLQKIAKMNTSLGFPQCCNVFVTNAKCFERGLHFFERPFEVLKGVVDQMSKSAEELVMFDYCMLVCVLIHGGLTKEYIERVDNVNSDARIEVTRIAKSCGIRSFVSLDILNAARRLRTSYLNCENETYSFKHNSMLEAVFSSFFNSRTDLLITHCDYDLLQKLVSTENSAEKSDLYCIVPQRHHKVLCARLATEMTYMNRNRMYWRLDRVLAHRAMSDIGFVQQFWAGLSHPLQAKIIESTGSFRDSILCVSGRRSFGCFVGALVSALKSRWSADRLERELGKALYEACAHGNYSVYDYLTSQLNMLPDSHCLRVATGAFGRSEIVSHLLQYNHWTPSDISVALSEACYWGKFDVYKSLLAFDGCDSNEILTRKILTKAAINGSSEIMSDLLQYKHWTIPDISSAVIKARSRWQVYKLLLGYNECDTREVLTSNFLKFVIGDGDFEIISDLLQYQHWTIADIFDSVKEACKWNRLDVYKALLEYGGYTPKDVMGGDVLSMVARNGNIEFVSVLLQHKHWTASDISEAILWAKRRDHFEIYKSLLTYGCHFGHRLTSPVLRETVNNLEYVTVLLQYQQWTESDVSHALEGACGYGVFDVYKSLMAYDVCDTTRVITHDVLYAAADGIRYGNGDTRIKADLEERGYELPEL